MTAPRNSYSRSLTYRFLVTNVLGKRDSQENEPVITNEKAGSTAVWSMIGRGRLGFLTVSLAKYFIIEITA